MSSWRCRPAVGEFTLELELADPTAAVAFLPGRGFVLLDTAVTPELAAEGLGA